MSANHTGSLPLTHVYTASMGSPHKTEAKECDPRLAADAQGRGVGNMGMARRRAGSGAVRRGEERTSAVRAGDDKSTVKIASTTVANTLHIIESNVTQLLQRHKWGALALTATEMQLVRKAM
jgi:hypothetical protein